MDDENAGFDSANLFNTFLMVADNVFVDRIEMWVCIPGHT